MSINQLLFQRQRSATFTHQERNDPENPSTMQNVVEITHENLFSKQSEEADAKKEENADLDIIMGEPTNYSQESIEFISSHLHTETIFKFKPFIIALFEHLLFFNVLGPFIYFYGCFANMNRLTNQSFVFGSDRIRMFLEQTLIWICVVSSTVLFFFVPRQTRTDEAELIMLYLAILVRSLFIAVKYAYCSDDFLRAFNMRILTRQEMQSEIMVTAWRPQTDDIIEKDLLATMVSEEVDNNLFYFNFIGYISREKERKLIDGPDQCDELARWRQVPADRFGRRLRTVLGLPPRKRKFYCGELKLFRRRNSKKLRRRHTFPVYERRRTRSISRQTSLEEHSQPKTNVTNVYSTTELATGEAEPKITGSDFHLLCGIGGSTANTQENRESNTEEPTLRDPKTVGFNKLTVEEKLKYYTDEIVAVTVRRHFRKRTLVLEKTKMSGYRLAVDLIKHSRKKRYYKEMWVALVIAIIKSLLPTLYRIFKKYTKDPTLDILGDGPLGIYLLFTLIIANCYFFWTNLFVVFQAISQYRAKLFLLLHLGNLISPRNLLGYKIERLYPTFDIFDPVSIKTWTNLRKILWNYGAKYQLRQDLNITFYALIYLIIMALVVTHWLGWLRVDFSNSEVILFSYESLVVVVVFVYVLVLAASINDTFHLYMNLLKKIKMIAGDMFQLDYAYFGEDAIEADNLIYRSGIMMLKKELGGENIGADKKKFEEFKTRLSDRLSKLLTMISEEIEDLGFEYVNNPYKIIGFSISWRFLSTLVLAFASFTFAVIKRQVERNHQERREGIKQLYEIF